MPTVNVKHVPSIDKCKCYLQAGMGKNQISFVVVAPCSQPADENTCGDCGEYIDDHDVRFLSVCDVQS